MYLLDTNVISEATKKNPHPGVQQWLSSIDPKSTFLTVLTLGEIRKGIEKLDDHFKKQNIIQWLDLQLPKQFYGRIISIDEKVADKWGYLSALRSMPAIDSLIAASAMVHNLKLVTRNTKDFQNIVGLELMNPWEL